MVIMISVLFVSYLAVQSCLQIEKAIRILRESLFFQKTIDSTVMLTQYLKYCSWNEKKIQDTRQNTLAIIYQLLLNSDDIPFIRKHVLNFG